jgi:hypothetical protein
VSFGPRIFPMGFKRLGYRPKFGPGFSLGTLYGIFV